MLKIHSEDASPACQHAISSPQLLQCCRFLNTSMTPNCLFIIEITGDFTRIKWQIIKFSLFLKEKKKERKKTSNASEALLPPPGDPRGLQAEHISLQRNIWNWEQATDPDRNPGISRATPVSGCWGICQSATFQSKTSSTGAPISVLSRDSKEPHNVTHTGWGRVTLLDFTDKQM